LLFKDNLIFHRREAFFELKESYFSVEERNQKVVVAYTNTYDLQSMLVIDKRLKFVGLFGFCEGLLLEERPPFGRYLPRPGKFGSTAFVNTYYFPSPIELHTIVSHVNQIFLKILHVNLGHQTIAAVLFIFLKQ
jgi:hypothetical protein